MSKENSITIVFPWGMSEHDKTFHARFKRFLKFANKQPVSQGTISELLFHLFGYDSDGELPIAAVEGLADNLPAQEGYWMHADPVVLKTDLAGIYMLDNQAIELDENHIKAFIEEISPLLDTNNERIFVPHPQRWYLKTNSNPQLNTTDPHLLIGKEISGYMPRGGSQQQKWRRLMTEIQMTLFQSKTNLDLKNAGKPEVSSVWFWGSGALPAKSMHMRWKGVWCDHLLTRGLAKLNNVSIIPFSMSSADAATEQSAAEVQPSLQEIMQSERSQLLIVCDQYLPASNSLKENKIHSDDFNTNEIILNNFVSLFRDLRKGIFDKIICYWGDGYRYELNSKDVKGWRYWLKRFF